MLFADLLSLHLVTFLMFFILVILSVSDLYTCTCRRGYVYWTAGGNPHKIERASLSDGADVTVLRTANTGEIFGRLIAVIVCSSP